MKAKQALPEGYGAILSVDLQKNKKLALWVNLLAVGIAVVLAVPIHFFISIFTLFDMSHGLGAYVLRFAVLLVGSVAYIILHELVHGVTMKCFGTKKVKYGFTGIYAFAGSDDYYDKKSYLTIALAPVVVFFVLFAILCPLVPREWFWVVYILQITNLSGAAGDLYVTCKFSTLPRDILVQDSGVGMTVYSATQTSTEE